MRDGSISLRVTLGGETMIGPGKADLLEGIRDTKSISAAGRRMGMSYKRAWYLIDTLNKSFREPVVLATKGGKAGGGARLTSCGDTVLDGYRRMERATAEVTAADVASLATLLKEEGDQTAAETVLSI